MQFHSAIFAVFAILFFALWPFARRSANTRWLTLVVASFIFYGWWDWRFLFLIVASGLLDFGAGLGMERFPKRRRAFLALSMTGNLGSLATFKYLGFATQVANDSLAAVGFSSAVPVVQLTLPVGISFYTFQSMSYTIDIYRGQLRPTRHVLHFFAYLSMFPQLVAGPIVRARDLLPQLSEDRRITDRDRWEGLVLIAHGYFKKVVIADNLAPMVNQAFGAATPEASGLYWWMVTTMFAFQIYCDFSGYSDIARGLARWMGFDFALNFNHPYVSSSLREFWGRWHISLSTWFRDYVYIPLGGGRVGAGRGHANMWLTMLVSGLWHGAAWTFVAWGALHATLLTIERVTNWPARLGTGQLARALTTFVVMIQVWIAWVFFRAENFQQAVEILTRMFDPASFDPSPIGAMEPLALMLLGVGIARESYFYLGLERSRWANSRLHAVLSPLGVALLLAGCVLFRGPGGEFIYFQF
jgi:D-alanyl-lipoteichoic acid acyltransferase DltB (MBOAT superfamily)